MSEHWDVRITGYDVLPVEEFLERYKPHPKNPRQHGEAQQAGVRGSLDSLGVYDVVIVSDKTKLFTDGHLRANLYSMKAGQPVPFVRTDLDEGEQVEALATHDFLTTMATYNRDMLGGLLQDVSTDNEAVMTMLAELEAVNVGIPTDGEGWGDAFGGLPTEDRSPFQQMTFTLHDTQVETVKQALALAAQLGDYGDTGNENSNGNGLARICEVFITQNG